ncbi:MAG TPA: carbohydrate ABC transporter permease [Verrucomicrobiae bacterium]|nr:carbohydrate ABC transporter permease [Verrucomicrobiae bacterium]
MPPMIRLRRSATDGLARLLAVAAAALFTYPLVLMVKASLGAPGGLIEPYRVAFEWVPLGRGLFNSLVVAAIAVPLTLAVSSMAGTGLALLSRRRQVLAITALLLVASIPLTAVWIPRFVMFEALGAVGTWIPLVAPALAGGSPLFVLLYFLAIRRIPEHLLEAARLEGLGLFGLWWRVALPLVRPTTLAVGLLATAQVWGNFIEAVLYLNAERTLTAPLMLHTLQTMGSTQWPVLMAGAVVVTAPVLVAFVALQRFFAAPEREGSWLGR